MIFKIKFALKYTNIINVTHFQAISPPSVRNSDVTTLTLSQTSAVLSARASSHSMPTCCAPGCTQTEKTSPGTSFFWLPWNEKERIKVWLAKLRLVHPPAKTARIYMSTDLSRWTQNVCNCTRDVKPKIVFCFRVLKPVSLVRS